jgi:predicted AlkP superfamily phosphohydrolase/phosphomutase
MAQPPRLLVLAMDAASPERLERWAADGTLPTLAGLMREGLTARSRSVDWLYVGATWPSFYTGLDVGRHGLYWVHRLKPGSYELATCTAEDFGRRRALWDVLSGAGRRIAVMDVPLCGASPHLIGTQVVGWGDHDAVFDLATTPPELRAQIERHIGHHPAPRRCDARRRSLADYVAFTDQLVRGAACRARLTRQVLEGAPWDLALQVFSETHCVGHQCWHFHDPHHPGHDPDAAREAGDPVRDVYAAVDRAIGEVIASVPADTTVVVMTLHGMGVMSGGKGLLPGILERLGAFTPEAPAAARPGARAAMFDRLASGWRHVPAGVKAALDPLRRRARAALAPRPPDSGRVHLDDAASRCFPLDTGFSVSGIRLNLVGREPAGTLTPGAQAEAFKDELIVALAEVMDPDTSRPLMPSVRRTSELFRGECLDQLPDLLVAWDLDRATGSTTVGTGRGARLRATSARIGLVERTNEYGRSGEHRIDGLVVARGPGIRPGRLDRTISDLDLAPTFARVLGCDMAGVDGVEIPELIAGGRAGASRP